ncbi:hypothetical protein BH11PAT4_BH11PAT4_5420 [soil metagenome]
MSITSDTIEREVIVKAPQERVYSAITDPAQITQWFPDAIEGDFVVGAQPVLNFGTDGKARIKIIDAKPFEYFAFRWVPGGGEVVADVTAVVTTLVEFMVEGMGDETKVTVKESGFSGFGPEVAKEKFEMNSGGWEYMMDRFEKFFA